MRMLMFAKRTAKEVLRDPLTFIFGIGFPVILLLLLSAIQANVPVPMFEIEQLVPGIAVFGLSFLTLFSATLIAQDRQSELLSRLCSTPMRPIDFILGYTLPVLPMALIQSFVCYGLGIVLGLQISVNGLIAALFIVPVSLLYIFLGLAAGSVLTVKQVGGLCGALLTNLSAWLSGTWFDISLVGKWFEVIANCLPFVHAVEAGRKILAGSTDGLGLNLLVIGIYIVACGALSIFAFSKNMRRK